MIYIKPEIEMTEVQTEDVITISMSSILNWDSLTDDQKSAAESGITASGSNVDISLGADFFN